MRAFLALQFTISGILGIPNSGQWERVDKQGDISNLNYCVLYPSYLFPFHADGLWQEWSPFSLCSVSCGTGGKMQRHRRCGIPKLGGERICAKDGQPRKEIQDCPSFLECPGSTYIRAVELFMSRIVLYEVQDTYTAISNCKEPCLSFCLCSMLSQWRLAKLGTFWPLLCHLWLWGHDSEKQKLQPSKIWGRENLCIRRSAQ